MKKKNYNKKFIAVLISAIAVTVALPVSIALMGIGVETDSDALIVLGSVTTVFSPVAIVILWVLFAKVRRRKILFNTVNLHGDLTITELTAITGRRSKYMIKDLQVLITTGYLKEYKFDGEMKRFYNFIKSAAEEESLKQAKAESIKCEGCGALAIVYDGAGKCHFCGRFLRL